MFNRNGKLKKLTVLVGSLCVVLAVTLAGTMLTTNAATFKTKIKPTAKTKVSTPVVNSFTSSATSVSAGDTVVLKWETTNATKVELLGIEKQDECVLPLDGSVEVWPLASTTYILRAYNSAGAVASKSIAVNVGTVGKVKVNYFNASPTTVAPGDTTTLSWSASAAKSIRIVGIEKQEEAVLPLKGSIEVWPMATTTYILEATGYNNEIASASVTVTVNTQSNIKLPQITKFATSENNVKMGTLVTLSWTTIDATDVSLVTSDGVTLNNRPATGKISITPNETKTYTLIAKNQKGQSVSKKITIVVK